MGAIQSTLTTALGAAQTIASTINTVQSLSGNDSSNELAIQQLQERQSLEEAQGAQDAALAAEALKLEAQQEATARQNALKKAVAAQRASYGASGISSNSGSAEAVLLGLYEETARDQADSNEQTGFDLKAIELQLSQEKAINVLQASQLKERQNLQSLY